MTAELGDGIYIQVVLVPQCGLIAAERNDRMVEVFDPVTLDRVFGPQPGYRGGIMAVGFSPAGDRKAIGGSDGSIEVVDLFGDTPPKRLREHGEQVFETVFSPDGTTLASGGTCVTLWDLATGTSQELVETTARAISFLAFSPCGSRLAIARAMEPLILWDLIHSRPICEISAKDHEWISSVAFSPDGTTLATTGWDGSARLWQSDDGRPLGRIDAYPDETCTPVFSPDGKRLLIGASEDSWLGEWELSSGQCLRQIKAHDGGVSAARFSPDGQEILTGGVDSALKLWDYATGELLQSHEECADCSADTIAFSGDGRYALTARDVFDLRSGQSHRGQKPDPLLHQANFALAMPLLERRKSLYFAPDGISTAVVKEDGVWVGC
jgi:WD40 repeat protein